MPHITNAMHRSVRRGVSDIVFDSLLGRRDVISQVDGVKNTFSSWDNCMAKVYCKWPVIIGIVIGGLFIFSVLWCVIRCACCGMSCCCTCFSFLKCCDCCGDSCAGKKDKPMRHLDEPYAPRQGFHNTPYQAPVPMMGGALGGKPEPPTYAQFEVGRSGLAVEPKSALSEDALPPMPSWDTAAKKHVLTEEEKNAIELGELDPGTGQKVPLMAGAVSPAIGAPPSPAHDPNPYGARPGQAVSGNGYRNVTGNAYGAPNAFHNGYRGQSPGPGGPGGYRGSPSPAPGRGTGGPGRGYGPGSMALDGQGRGDFPQSPEDQYANDGFGGPTAGYGRAQPQRQNSNDTYGSRPYPPPQRQYTDDSSRPLNQARQYSDRPYPLDNFQPPRGPSRGPGGPNRVMSPSVNNSGFNDQPYPSDNFQPLRGPSRGPGGPGGPNRIMSPPLNNSGFNDQPYPADNFQPSRGPPRGPGGPNRAMSPPTNNSGFEEQPYQQNFQPSRGPAEPHRIASPPLNNNSGFDFVGSGGQQPYSRPSPPPQQMSYGSSMTSAPSYASREPQPQEQSYPGYKPYQAPNQSSNHNRAPTALTPGGRREPQKWDPVQP